MGQHRRQDRIGRFVQGLGLSALSARHGCLLSCARRLASREGQRRLQKPDAELFVSIVTPWEIALKRSLQVHGLNNNLIISKIEELGARLLPITTEHTALLYTLPYLPDHRDPFDRMLIAQALDKACTLVSNDSRFTEYQKAGLKTLWQ